MPYLQHPDVGERIRFARSDHAIAIPRPAFDAALSITGACAQCHGDRPLERLEQAVREWWGGLKPQPAWVGALLDTASTLSARDRMLRLMRDDVRHTVGQERVLAELLERYLEPDMASLDGAVVQRLRHLAQSQDLDVRSLALAALHLAQGEQRVVRKFLAAQLRALGSRERMVRDRWRVALGYLGDRDRESGQARRALQIYAKALEVGPEDAGILHGMGLAYAAAGDQVAAAEHYRRSLRADAAQPLVHINLGVALEALGDGAGATLAYRTALGLNPREPLALFNLGNGSFRQRDYQAAIQFYLQAIEADRGMTAAHVNLARAYGATGRLADALAEARWALELGPEDPAVLELVTQLQALRSGS